MDHGFSLGPPVIEALISFFDFLDFTILDISVFPYAISDSNSNVSYLNRC